MKAARLPPSKRTLKQAKLIADRQANDRKGKIEDGRPLLGGMKVTCKHVTCGYQQVVQQVTPLRQSWDAELQCFKQSASRILFCVDCYKCKQKSTHSVTKEEALMNFVLKGGRAVAR
jgi:hypothetical protein